MVKLKIKKEDILITILDESDIQNRLDDKIDVEDAFSGSYNDLSNKPTIPSDIDDLGLDTVTMTVTYEDDSTEDIEFVIIPNNNGE